MKLELQLLDGSNHRTALTEGVELTVGTSSQCSVRLAAGDVSRMHALLTCRHGTVALLDLGSTNGTWVNGRRVKEAELSSGDVVRFSSVVAQVVPEAAASRDGDGAAERIASTQHRSPGEEERVSGQMPIFLQDSVLWLLRRWDIAGSSSLLALAEWLVSQRGMRGAAVAEAAGDETVLRATAGDLENVLDDPRLTALVREAGRHDSAIENVQLTLGGQEVLAVHGPGLPCLIMLPGTAMPDSVEIELCVALLRVAQRLDLPPQRGKRTPAKA